MKGREHMAALLDSVSISTTQRVELYEEGIIWIIDDDQHKEIKLDAATSTQLFDFLLLHQERLIKEARADRGGA